MSVRIGQEVQKMLLPTVWVKILPCSLCEQGSQTACGQIAHSRQPTTDSLRLTAMETGKMNERYPLDFPQRCVALWDVNHPRLYSAIRRRFFLRQGKGMVRLSKESGRNEGYSNPMIGATLVSAPLVGGEKGREMRLSLSFGRKFAGKDERANPHSVHCLFFSPIFFLLAKRRIHRRLNG